MSKQKVQYLSLGIKKALIFDISGVTVRSSCHILPFFNLRVSLPVTVALILVRCAVLKRHKQNSDVRNQQRKGLTLTEKFS